MALTPPIANLRTARINRSLHGRSVHRPENLSGHNVFKGYTAPGTGDALDVEGVGWRTEVVAVCAGRLTNWRMDGTKREVVYLEGRDGDREVIAIYAHIDVDESKLGRDISPGEPIGRVRGDLSWDHLHFELWIDGTAVSAPTPEKLRAAMLEEFTDENDTPDPWAAEAWAWAEAEGILDGTRPRDPLTRQEYAVIRHRAHAGQ